MSLTIAVIVKNAALFLNKALTSASFASEIIIVDNHSTDDSVNIARQFTPHIYSTNASSFAEKRNLALKKTKTSWIFFLDADEIITDSLKNELIKKTNISTPPLHTCYRVTRQNYFLGTKMYPDQVERLFYVPYLQKFAGEVHEHALYRGQSSTLSSSLIHHTHTNIRSMLEKTNYWSEIEAKLLHQSSHPPMAGWRLFRIALTQAWQQFVKFNLLKYGRPGLFEGLFQIINSLIVYTKLYEKQKNESHCL